VSDLVDRGGTLELFWKCSITFILPLQVYLFDFGQSETLPSSQLRTLASYHKSLPCGAVRCHFGDVTPAGDKYKWSRTACEALTMMVASKTFFVHPTVN